MNAQGFKAPESILRPCPFWAINDEIVPAEIAKQMEELIRIGFSGGFFHSRHGLVTEYMGEDWFKAMDAALDVAGRMDGYVWLYDEDLWPSGNAGGQVAGMRDEYRAASLNAVFVAACEPAPELTCDQELRQCYAINKRNGLHLTDFEPVPLGRMDAALQHERLLLVRTYAEKTGWWSGESYANLLDPEAMRQFVRLTHDAYFKKYGHEFGKRIPGIFTDEPHILTSETGIAWYDGLPDIYGNWTGRDFWTDIPFMFFEGAQSRKVRLLVHRTILRQFTEAYSKPIFEWCEKHGIEHTGHYNAEDSLTSQIAYHSGGVMSHYRYQQAPGIDHLCRQIDDDLYGVLLTTKQVSSAARQLGRTRVLDEIFGVSRHTNTFEDFKWLGDHDLVHGVNFLVPHLAWYSAKGRRKRDFPPNWNYQQTYWNDLKPLNDYLTRVAYALTQGKVSVDIVMLHPVESATAARSLGVEVSGSVENNWKKLPLNAPIYNTHAAKELDFQMRKALESILTAGYACDLGDESYLDDLGSAHGDSFVIGEMSYKLVVIPPSTTWRPKTFDLLKQFVTNGGKVVILGEIPRELDCDDAHQQWDELAKHSKVWSIACGVSEIQTLMDEIAPKAFTLKGTDGRAVPRSYVQRRIDDGQEIYFVVNSSRDATRDYVMTFIGGKVKTIVAWDGVDGTCGQLSGYDAGADLRLEFSLPPCGSLLLTLGDRAPDSKKILPALHCRNTTISALPTEFNFERKDANVLVLDRISVSYDGSTFSSEDLEHRIRSEVRTHFGTEAMLEWQPWVAKRKQLFEGKGGEIVLRYKFISELDKPKSFAVIEDISKGQLFVNGIPIDTTNPDWHWDRAFGKVDITEHMKLGENVMDFKLHYTFLSEVEAAYIVGDFGVTMADLFRGKIVKEPKTLKTGTWTSQGYPFYPGRIVYKSSFEANNNGNTVILRLKRPSGVLFKVRVNGESAGSILWRPYEMDITQYVRPGVNQIEIEVVSSMQNAWGPLHEKIGDDNMWCSPEAFEDDSLLREELNLFPYGLLGGVEIVIAERLAQKLLKMPEWLQ